MTRPRKSDAQIKAEKEAIEAAVLARNGLNAAFERIQRLERQLTATSDLLIRISPLLGGIKLNVYAFGKWGDHSITSVLKKEAEDIKALL